MAVKKLTIRKKPSNIEEAANVVSAAAGLATAVIANAAQDATSALAVAAKDATAALAVAAADASKVVQDSTTKALLEFPDIKEDIREIRASQSSLSMTLTSVVTGLTSTVTELITEHTAQEDTRLKSIDTAVQEIKLHLKTQNGRIAKTENHITRLNLVFFGIAGPMALVVFGYIAHAYILANHWFGFP